MATEQTPPKSQCPFPPPQRFISTHTVDGKSVFYTDIPSEIPCQPIRRDLEFYLAWTTCTFPVDISKDTDIQRYRAFLDGTKPGLTNKGGVVLRVCNFAPGSELEPPMHRTISVDFGIVTAGEIESVMDSGESRLMKVGDIMVQRETNHAWRNPSKNSWARVVFVLQEARAIQVGTRELKEDYGEIPNIALSS